MRPPLAAVCCAAVLATPALAPRPAAAQEWNGDSALALARRAIERRERTATDTALRDYKAQAHGFVFFLGQFGEGLSEPPRLVKADQLELEVYWKAPGLSKQRIAGWRDRAELPTDINYHRDHLGIVQNNFGRVVRLGDGDEVRDVPHPLAPGGTEVYDFALGDTIVLTLPQRAVRVAALRVRPKDFGQPRLVGTLYVDVETADLVRLAFNFTPRSYVDPQVEDVSIVLDNALWEGRFWLPYRQEIEIRRRATWLDIPARGIIRGRWEIDGYLFNLGLVDSWFAGDEIVVLPKAERDAFPWATPLGAALQDIAEPVRHNDLQAVRREVARIAGRRALSGLKPQRLGVRSVSDLVRVNRVEGLAGGAGVVWRAPGDAIELRALASYGLADRRAKGALTASWGSLLEAAAYREVRDVADVRVIAPILNSLGAQEFGADYGDYYLATGVRGALRANVGARGDWRLTVARERTASLPVRAAPATGRFRPNSPLGSGDWTIATLTARRRGEGFAVRRDVAAELSLEGGWGSGGRRYLRLAGQGHALLPVGSSRVLVRAHGGAGGADLPAHRGFVLGGRATLLGDAFRAWGGRHAAALHVEWRAPVPFVRMAAGPYARTPGTITLAPFVAAGSAGQALPAVPWSPSGGTRVTLGLGIEWLGVFRVELGYGAQSRRVRASFDVTRDFWDIL